MSKFTADQSSVFVLIIMQFLFGEPQLRPQDLQGLGVVLLVLFFLVVLGVEK